MVADAHHPDCHQGQGNAGGEVFAFQKGSLRRPILVGRRLRNPRFFVAEARRPLRRRDNGPVVRDHLEEIELIGGGKPFRAIYVRGVVGRGLANVNCHAQSLVCAGDTFHAPADFLGAPGKLAPELSDQRSGPLAIEPLERIPHRRGDDPCHQADRVSHRGGENKEQFRAEAHGCSASRETFSRCQSPQVVGDQPLTRAARPTSSGTYSSGTSVKEPTSFRSALYTCSGLSVSASGESPSFEAAWRTAAPRVGPPMRTRSTRTSVPVSGMRSHPRGKGATCRVRPASRAFTAIRSAIWRVKASLASYPNLSVGGVGIARANSRARFRSMAVEKRNESPLSHCGKIPPAT